MAIQKVPAEPVARRYIAWEPDVLAVPDTNDLGAIARDRVAIFPFRVVAEIKTTDCVVQRVAVGIEDSRVGIVLARPTRLGSNVGEVDKPDADFAGGAGVCDGEWEGEEGERDASKLHSGGCLVL